MIESSMITDTFLFFEFLLLLLMLFSFFELETIFFLLCTFKVVISCFGMLSLLCFRINFSEFLRIFVTEMLLLLFVNAENWFDEAVSWSGMVITWSSACLFVISLLLWVSREPVSIRNIDHVIFCVFFCYIIFFKVFVPAFLCPFSYVLKIVLVFYQLLNNRSFIFVFLAKMMNLF